MQVWNEVNGVPSVFNIKNGVQTSNGDDICLEAESLTSTAKLTAQKCSASNLQKWYVFHATFFTYPLDVL
jgi:hypothetical protein